MIEFDGNLFDTTAPAIGQGVNCAGLMGAGIAKTFRELYPHNYENYKAACLAGQLKPGGVHVNYEKGIYVINMASQNTPGRDASYPWLFESALHAAEGAVKVGLTSIAIPEIGCGIGGLEWRYAKLLLESIEEIVNGDAPVFKWEVWHYAG